jgi:hypothetical protein
MTPSNDRTSDWTEILKRQGVPDEKLEAAKRGALRMGEAASGLLFDPRDAIGPDAFSKFLSELGKAEP